MAQHPSGKRYLVSNFGFGFAVQDTGHRYEQGLNHKGEEIPDSSNPRNARVLEVFPTRAQAQAYADELNAKAESA
ncbi:MAG: hypothetical protein AAF682_15350 [Planctomycetota bacterium]